MDSKPLILKGNMQHYMTSNVQAQAYISSYIKIHISLRDLLHNHYKDMGPSGDSEKNSNDFKDLVTNLFYNVNTYIKF